MLGWFMPIILERTEFTKSRQVEYLDLGELEKMTGLPRRLFPAAVFKELLDNALDEAELNGSPKVEATVRRRGRLLRVAVVDNGCGLSLETLRKVLDFATRTSDKEVYKAPTRGAQGNALKTVAGLTLALRKAVGNEKATSLIVEAHGQRHRVRLGLDPLTEELDPRIHTNNSESWLGTKIVVYLDLSFYGDLTRFEQGLERLAAGFVIFNPHVMLNITLPGKSFARDRVRQTGKMTKATPTSAHHYTPTDLRELVRAELRCGKQVDEVKSLREFAREFSGLSSSMKVGQIGRAMQVEGVGGLSDLMADGHLEQFLTLMQDKSKAPKPNSLGTLEEDGLRSSLADLYKVADESFKYKRITGSFRRDGAQIPFAVELASGIMVGGDAEAEYKGRELLTGINYAPTYVDPFNADEPIFTHEVTQVNLNTYGLSSVLEQLKISEDDPVIVAAHLVCPNLQFTDRGKTRLIVPEEIAQALTKAAWLCCKEWYNYKRRLEREARSQEREAEEILKEHRTPRNTQKDATFRFLEEAVRFAKGDLGIASVRDVWYALRPLIGSFYGERSIPKYDYFSQNLFWDWGGDTSGIYNEDRGVAVLPNGQTVELGTRQVEAFAPELWSYDKALYIEKRGKLPQIIEAGFHRKYDLVLVADPGYSTHAARAFLAKLAQAGCTILCAHDCDVDGWNILRTLRSPSRLQERLKLPVFAVTDLGLRVEDVRANDFQIEPYTYKKDLPSALNDFLSTEDLDWLKISRAQCFTKTGSRRSGWELRRVELNALQGDALVTWLEGRLQELGLARKLRPPRKRRRAKAQAAISSQMETVIHHGVTSALEKVLKLDDLEEACREIPTWYANRRTRRGRRFVGRVTRATLSLLDKLPPEGWQELTERSAMMELANVLDGFDLDAHVRRLLEGHLEKVRQERENELEK